MDIKLYDIQNWYWHVADDFTRVYSSKACDFVPVEDADYNAWKVEDGVVVSIDSEFSLGGVLGPYLELRPIPQGVLDGYTDARLQALKGQPDYNLWVDAYASNLERLKKAI